MLCDLSITTPTQILNSILSNCTDKFIWLFQLLDFGLFGFHRVVNSIAINFEYFEISNELLQLFKRLEDLALKYGTTIDLYPFFMGKLSMFHNICCLNKNWKSIMIKE